MRIYWTSEDWWIFLKNNLDSERVHTPNYYEGINTFSIRPLINIR